jgi:O-antigen/teichoic acid export membrane protein
LEISQHQVVDAGGQVLPAASDIADEALVTLWADLVRSSIVAILLKGVGATTGLAYGVVLAQSLGAEGLGVYYLALTVVSIGVVLGRFGLDTTLLRYVSIFAKKADWRNVRYLARNGQLTVTAVSSLLAVLVYFIAPWVSENVFFKPDLETPLRWMAISVVPMALVAINAELLKAVNRVGTGLLMQSFAVPLISLVLLFFLKDFGVLGAVLAHVGGSTVAMTLSCLLVRWSYPHISSFFAPLMSHRVLLKTAVPMMTVAFMNLLIDMTDTLMIGVLLTSQDVGIYGVALRITAISSLILVAVNSVVAGRFASLWSEQSLDELSVLARRTTLAMTSLATIMLLVFVCLAGPILAWFGSEFVDGANVLRILAVSQFFVLATGPVAYLLMMTGHEQFHRNNLIACAILNVLLNLIFIPEYGISGAAFATALSLSIKNFLALLFVRNKLNIKTLF